MFSEIVGKFLEAMKLEGFEWSWKVSSEVGNCHLTWKVERDTCTGVVGKTGNLKELSWEVQSEVRKFGIKLERSEWSWKVRAENGKSNGSSVWSWEVTDEV